MILEGRRSRELMLKDAKDEIAEYKKTQKEMIKNQVNSNLQPRRGNSTTKKTCS